MTQVPDNPLRLYLRVALKVATLAALGMAAVVLLQYIGLGDSTDPDVITRVNVSDVGPDQARREGWDGGAVWVLHRSEATRAELATEAGADDGSFGRWFVVLDRGARTGCSLLWHAAPREFRETCSDARYDAAGRPVGDTGGGDLRSPPFTRSESADVVIVGR